jgi:pyruvate/2-oxoacid:ferredoxin oxidoreductase alpha subunit
MLKNALARLDEEIPRVQEMYDNAVEDGEKTEDYRLSVAILRGTKAGLKDQGFSAGVGLVPLRELKREIKKYLKHLPEVQPEVEEVQYGEPPTPSPEEAEAEQAAIEESIHQLADKKNRVLQKMILEHKKIAEYEESPDESIHELIAEELAMQENLVAQQTADERAIQEHIFKERLVVEMTENFRMMLRGLFGIN